MGAVIQHEIKSIDVFCGGCDSVDSDCGAPGRHPPLCGIFGDILECTNDNYLRCKACLDAEVTKQEGLGPK